MKLIHSTPTFALLVLTVLHLALPGTACAADETTLYQESPSTGTSIPRKLVIGGRLPISKTYEQLSDAEKQIVKSYYNDMPPEDEPPYPKSGLVAIYKPISEMQSRFLGKGEVEMYVTVGPTGKPLSVSIYKTPDPDLAKALASLLMLTEYKAAICKGKPCTMEFPLVLTLTVTN